MATHLGRREGSPRQPLGGRRG